MLILKCIGTAILSGFITYICIGILMLVITLVVGEEVANQWAALFVVITGLCILGGMIYGFMTPIWEKAERRRKVEAEKAARLHGYRKQMSVLGEQSIGLFESLTKHLSSAEEYLEQAEVNFSDRAFAPFWDSIENAAKILGRFDEGVRQIKDNLSRYTELVREYKDTPLQFPLSVSSVEKLSVGMASAERMQAVVRKAQRDFQFAMIYEQRKTNQILVAGFKNLAQALEQMTWQITASIDDLAGSVGAIHSQLGHFTAMTNQQNVEQAARERKALEMLDNIQRGRGPFP